MLKLRALGLSGSITACWELPHPILPGCATEPGAAVSPSPAAAAASYACCVLATSCSCCLPGGGAAPSAAACIQHRCCQLRRGLQMHEPGHGSLRPLECSAIHRIASLRRLSPAGLWNAAKRWQAHPCGSTTAITTNMRCEAAYASWRDTDGMKGNSGAITSVEVAAWCPDGQTPCPRDGYTVCAGAAS